MNTQSNITKATHIIWNTFTRNHWQMEFKGTYDECLDKMEELGQDGHEIHPNAIKDSWDNAFTKTHFDVYSDDTCESRPMTPEEIENNG
jgi:hypothetical protein